MRKKDRLYGQPARALLLVVLLAAGCLNPASETAVVVEQPTPTSEPTPVADPSLAQDFIVVATDAPNPPFSVFDEYGDLNGFDSRLLEYIATEAKLDYEIVVTPFQGVLENIAQNPNRDFDAVMSNLPIPDEAPAGIAYTIPYLEVGQVLIVLADEAEIVSYQEIPPGSRLGVIENSQGELAANALPNPGGQLVLATYGSSVQALQALIDEAVDAVILDSYAADYFTASFPDQLKIAGGSGRDAWITSKGYGIALAARDVSLRERLNAAITAVTSAGRVERLTVAWLIPPDPLNPGESRVGTSPNELVIGFLGDLADMDPASGPDLIGWEVKNNTMSGLYRFNSDNELEPILASGQPSVSEDKLEYTITLRRGLRFGDGSELTADDVKWSIDRARSLGNFLVNGYLKDGDGNNFADDDAVQIVDQYTVKLVLQAPTAYFPSILATPPYFPISNECFAETWDVGSSCGGIGPYSIREWLPGERMSLQSNPEWPGRPVPAFENVLLRFFDDAASLRRSLVEFGSVDLAWSGLPGADYVELSRQDSDGDGTPDFATWVGPADFKSYLMFNQDVEPWNSEKARQAVAYAVDRQALAETVFGGLRQPLLSPIPDAIPGHIQVLPERNLAQARALLLEEGYSPANKLEMALWFVNDGRYSSVEETYANALKAQLEETNVFAVTVTGAPFEVFRAQIAECNYPAYLIGWPSPGQPTSFLDASAWTDFFVTSNSFCSNYDSKTMTDLVTAAGETLDPAARQPILEQIQTLWARELPTLDLLQSPRYALSLPNVNNVKIDALGLLHYELLAKAGG